VACLQPPLADVTRLSFHGSSSSRDDAFSKLQDAMHVAAWKVNAVLLAALMASANRALMCMQAPAEKKSVATEFSPSRAGIRMDIVSLY